MRVTIGLALLVTIGLLPAPATAQRINGEVKDLATQALVEGAAVTLRDSAGAVVRRALTGPTGRFTLDGVPIGPLTVEVEALGYAVSATRRVVYDGQPLFLEIGLEPAPVGTEGIQVIVTPQQPFLRVHGFYDRLRSGHGEFVTAEDIERMGAIRPSEILRRIPSVTVAASEPIISRGGVGFNVGRNCVPNVWIDGAAIRLGTRVRGRYDPNAFDNIVPPPEHIEAVEVYPGGATIPARWRGGNSGCGVIVIWTKH